MPWAVNWCGWRGATGAGVEAVGLSMGLFSCSVCCSVLPGLICSLLHALFARGRSRTCWGDDRSRYSILGRDREVVMDIELQDRLAIRDLVENWVVWRDAGDWARFRTVWFDDGRMMATWTQGTADEFIQMSKDGWAKGVS